MKLLHLQQGTQEWLNARAKCACASDAPAVLGCSPYKTRAQLLREKHTGVPADIDIATQKLFDNGHRAEKLALPLAEEFIGAELFPVVCVSDDGAMLASMDGLTLDETTGFEHKALNAELRAIFASGTDDMDGSLLPLMHRAQMEMQLLISGAQRVLFMASDWTAADELVEEHHCWYYPDAALCQQILDGWNQFERDLADYTLAESAAAAPVGNAPQTLPALRIEITGAVTASNLAEFKQTALAAIRSVNRALTTDQDFADADKAIKWCGDVENRLAAAKEHALSQTSSIDQLFKALDDIAAESKRVRLDLDKLVTRRKTEVKEEAVTRARAALAAHVAALDTELKPASLLLAPIDFGLSIKGMRSMASMQDALDTAVANGKIAADAAARGIRANLAAYREHREQYGFLFADIAQIARKAPEDFATLVQSRIDAHKATEQLRLDTERERIRAEEVARIERETREAAAKVEAERLAAVPIPAAIPTASVSPPAAASTPPVAAPPEDMVWYSSSDCEDPARYELRLQGPYDVTRPIEQIDIAGYAADDFHNAHGGREARWPRDITLYETVDGPPMASFEVEREHEPRFYARRKKAAA